MLFVRFLLLLVLLLPLLLRSKPTNKPITKPAESPRTAAFDPVFPERYTGTIKCGATARHPRGSQMSQSSHVDRRGFLKTAGGVSAGLSLAASAFGAKSKMNPTRVLGANDKINVGVIGTGGRGHYVADVFAKIGAAKNSCQVLAVCDVWQKRVNKNKEHFKADGYLDYREVINRSEIDAVLIATPDHWHAKI